MLRPRVSSRRNKGAVTFLFATGLVTFLGFTAIAVDLGILYAAYTQALRAAESGALAGAGYLIRCEGSCDFNAARIEAEAFAELHSVMGDTVDIDPAVDVEFEADTLVRVYVERTAARPLLGGPVTTFFARIFGIAEADVATKAAAVIAPGGSVGCLFPFIPPDAWLESSGTRSADSVFSDFSEAPVFDTTAGDFYDAPPSWGAGFPAYTGYGALTTDRGRFLLAKAGEPGNFVAPGWWYPLNNPPTETGGGMSQLRSAIAGECEEPFAIEAGDPAQQQTGFGGESVHGALRQAVQGKGPADSSSAVACYLDLGSCPDARRIRPMAFYDPHDVPAPGSSDPLTVGNFGDVWLAGFCEDPPQSEHTMCQALPEEVRKHSFAVMYLGPTTGYAAASPAEASPGVLALRLVE